MADPGKTGILPKDSTSLSYCRFAINSFNHEFENKLRQSPVLQENKIKLLSAPSLMFLTDSIRKNQYVDSLRTLYLKEKNEVFLLRYGFKIFFGSINWTAWKWPTYQEHVINCKFQFVLINLKTKEVYDSYQKSFIQTWVKESKSDSISRSVVNASKSVAELYACRVAPYWSTEERQIIYSSNRLMRKAYGHFCKNDLDKAMETWKRLYEVGTRRLSARAAFNIALICEIKDDLDACENWLIKSNLKKLNPSTKNYLDIIRKRKLDRVTIDIQF
jgi:hypothetical protein